MSTPEPDWERVKAIFDELRDLAPAAQRERLAAACQGDEALASEVASLLEWDSDADGFLDPDSLDAVLHDDTGDDLVGQTAGPYRVEARIGQGGMGAVYRAVRADETFERTVALKAIKRGMDTAQIVQRFEQERRALAALDHPNIARLIDGGALGDGRPYFVMELVDGEPVTTWCDRTRSGVRERLRLFLQVCHAVTHAHRSLIVHRDLKPDNILVTRDGVPKLLDFGIAKLLERTDDHATIDPALQPMTPEFASPEQRRGEPVTTASDVYSLGVVLHELLYGWHPGTAGHGRTQPGTLLPDRIDDVAASRNSAEGPLRRTLRGDLQTIVRKALQEEVSRRYVSSEQLADDLQRYLDGMPVRARADSRLYRTAKFVRRHRLGVGVAAAFGVVLVVGIGAVVWQSRIAARERNEARTQAARAERIATMLGDIFRSPDPLKQGRDVRVADVLDEASKRVDRELSAEPQVRAALLLTIGRTFMSLGLLDRAEDHVRRALDLRLHDPAATPDDVAGAYADLGSVIRTRGDLKGAEVPMRQALDLFRQAHGAAHPSIAMVMNDLGGLLLDRGDLAGAEQLQRDALAMRRALLGPMHRDVADSLNDLGVVLGTAGNFRDAEPLHREALEIARTAEGPRHPDVASTMMTLAFVREMNGSPSEAETLYRDALDIRREALGNTHPETAWTIYSYAAFLRAQQRYADAVPLLTEVLALRGRTLPDSHAMIGSSLYELGRSYQGLGDLPRAEAALRDCIAVRRASLPADSWLVPSVESSLGEVLLDQGRVRDAAPLLVASEATLLQRLGADHPAHRDAAKRLARLPAHQPR